MERGKAFYEVIKIILWEKLEKIKNLKIRDIKGLAIKIRKNNYLIAKENDKDQIRGDQFLDSPYFDFIAKVLDSAPSDSKEL